jgi:hypothetical protein
MQQLTATGAVTVHTEKVSRSTDTKYPHWISSVKTQVPAVTNLMNKSTIVFF